MAAINKVFISGNIVRDAELRQTNGKGTSVLNFSVAVNERRQNKDTGEWEDHPNFIDCSMFGKRAEAIAKYILKGTKVSIEGALRQNQWKDKETGNNRSRITVLVDEIEFMSSRNDSAVPTSSAADDEDMPF